MLQALQLSWLPRVTDGVLMRAESSYDFCAAPGSVPGCDASANHPQLSSAGLYGLDGDSIQQIEYQEIEHFRVTRGFLNAGPLPQTPLRGE